MNGPRRLAEFRAQRELDTLLARLEDEISRRTHKRHLTTLVLLAARLLPECGTGLHVSLYRDRIESLRARVDAPRPRKGRDFGEGPWRPVHPVHPVHAETVANDVAAPPSSRLRVVK